MTAGLALVNIVTFSPEVNNVPHIINTEFNDQCIYFWVLTKYTVI